MFHNENIGARKIAKKLGIKHHATVSKRLIKMGLSRGMCIEEKSKQQFKFNRNNIKLHAVAELELIKLCSWCNIEYAIPARDAPYDLLMMLDGKLNKIQVKSSYNRSKSAPGYVFNLYKSRINSTSVRKFRYTKNECDYFFLYDVDGDQWLIPFHLLCKQSTVSPQNRFPGYKIQI